MKDKKIKSKKTHEQFFHCIFLCVLFFKNSSSLTVSQSLENAEKERRIDY